MQSHTGKRRFLPLIVFGCIALSIAAGLAWLPTNNVAAQIDDTSIGLNEIQTTDPITVTLVQYAAGFNSPVSIAHANDHRIFVVEQGGLIRILDGPDQIRPNPFLNYSSEILTGAERGLLGMAFSPDYETSGEFYINYTRSGDGATVVARCTVSANPNIANPGCTPILTQAQSFSNHNAGAIAFGPDNYLYVPMGDGGSGGDPEDNGQDPETLLGKILRIDVMGETTYAIPADNPFVGNGAVLDEIWAFGVRNPWRFSFDRVTGDMWVGDVGQNIWEEINFQPAASAGGENYGWRCYEANATFNLTDCGPMGDYDFPVFAYDHTLGASVTGGFVYRGELFPELHGHYFLADFGSGRFWTLSPDGGSGFDVASLGVLASNPSTFGEDKYGEMYVATYFEGAIYQIQESRPVVYGGERLNLPSLVVEELE